MYTARLQARCASARFYAAGWADGFELMFAKRSVDGSGKATIWPCTARNARVHGVVFNLNTDELDALDRIEGRGQGYSRIDDFKVTTEPGGVPVHAVTYIAEAAYIDEDLRPYDWYLRLAIAGAREHRLPKAYVDVLCQTNSTPDTDLSRKSRCEALALLPEANLQ